MTLTTQQKLDDAKEKFHQLQTGQLPRVVVDMNGERCEFTAANAGNLQRYIWQLEEELGTASYTNRRPLRMTM